MNGVRSKENEERNQLVSSKSIWELIQGWLNLIQDMTDSIVYKVLAGIICAVIFIILCSNVFGQLLNLSIEDLCEIINIDKVLAEIKNDNYGKYYFKDQRIRGCVDGINVNNYYNNLLVVLNRSDLLDIKWKMLGIVEQGIFNISMVVAILPFVLNLSWSSNIFTIFSVFLTKRLFTCEKPIMIVTLSFFINAILGTCLLASHCLSLCTKKIEEKEKKADVINKNE